MMRTLKKLMYITPLIISLWGCSSDFLDAKPQKSLLIPSTLNELEALLNNSISVMNRAGYLTLVADGDFRMSEAYLSVVDDPLRINYTWSDETPNLVGDWDNGYRQIFYANVVLEGLGKLKEGYDQTKADELRGRALFYRAWALHLTSQQFAEVYDTETALSTLGIPCPLSPDVNQITKRITLQETFEQIINDLNEASPLLPEVAVYITQPSKVATHALLARLYLLAGDYEKALTYSEQVLALTNELLDYNVINSNVSNPFPNVSVSRNPEMLYYSFGVTSFTANTNVFVDSVLYAMYENNDLRKKIFFTNLLNYKGSYSGSTTPFFGLATDEVYLIKAECEVRLGEIVNAENTLNFLRSKRYSKDGLEEMSGMTREALLKLILAERRKELVGRGITWMDLRRLNKDPDFERTLVRKIGGKTYMLMPGGKRYSMKIPMDEIVSSGIEQNP